MARGNPKRNPYGVDNSGKPIVPTEGVTIHTEDMPANVLRLFRRLREKREHGEETEAVDESQKEVAAE